MKTLIVSTAAALCLATGAFADQNNTTDKIELELLRSGQLELAKQYDMLSEAEKRQFLRNEDPWVRQAAADFFYDLYN